MPEAPGREEAGAEMATVALEEIDTLVVAWSNGTIDSVARPIDARAETGDPIRGLSFGSIPTGAANFIGHELELLGPYVPTMMRLSSIDPVL